MNQPQVKEKDTAEVIDAPLQEDGATTGQEVTAPRGPRAPLVAGGSSRAIIPTDIEQAYRLASAICAADMAPKSYKRDANAVMVGILHGLEVGFTPMAALQSIAVINGMPSIWGDGALALIEASGLLEDKEERMDTDEAGGLVAICRMKRKGRSWTEQRFSWQDAKTAKLDQKDTYKLYGRRMLQRRARAWCMTDGFADVLRGLHIREAVDDGALVESASGVYEVANTQAAATPRPTRESTKENTERARKVAVAQDKQYRDTMAESAATAMPPQPDHDPETGVVHEEQPKSQAVAAQLTPKAQTGDSRHVATERVIRRKLEDLKSLRMFSPAYNDYQGELEEMRVEDPQRHTKLMHDILAKHPDLNK